jgi:hydroxyacylglutathione hydrolase
MALLVDSFEIMSNCHVVRADAGAAEAVVVDPGGGAAQLQAVLGRMDATCAAILVTHADIDHVSGVADLAAATGAPVYAPEPALMPAVRAQGGGILPPPKPYTVQTIVSDGDRVEAAGIAFEVIGVPGHSADHVAYYAGGALFAGDVLMQMTVGRTDLPSGDWPTLVASIRTLMDRLPPDTDVYPGHGAPTTLGDERARNPFLAELRA